MERKNDAKQEIETVLKRRDIRSPDRANMERMLRQLQRGKSLSSQERLNLWAYLVRYLGPNIA